jgi:hypothetical protein
MAVRRPRAAGAVLFVLGAGCAPARTGWRERPGVADARAYYYTDNSGVSVKTLATSVEQPVARTVGVSARAIVEQIVLRRTPLDPGDPGAMQSTGHPPHEPDAVTSASATAGGGSAAEEWRLEGTGAVAVTGGVGGAPATGRVLVKASTEPDYGSIYGNIGGSLELAERNTVLGAFAGYGQDSVDPVEAPPGQRDDWPATHRRVNGWLTATQIISRDTVASAGLGLTWQWGQLASPYRRALVRTTLFPEAVPGDRGRATAFAALSWYLGRDTALHLRQGVYADTWSVLAVIPELAVATNPAPALLVTARYRLYRQWPAEFFEAHYHDVEPIMTGDVRLGPITEHGAGAEARWTLAGEYLDFSSLALILGYELSILTYEEYATDRIIGHVATVGIVGGY